MAKAPAAKQFKTTADLIQDSRNANKGSERGDQAISHSLSTYGAGRSILLDKNGRIIAGNKTVKNAAGVGITDLLVVKSDGKKLVAVQRTDLDLETDPEAKALAVADNRSAELSLAWDAEILEGLAGEIDLSAYFTEDELGAIYGAEPKELKTDEDAVPPVPAEPVSKLGDLWVLGERNTGHRLLCGDSTKREDVERLMGGEKAALFATDPPYGVAYGDETGDKASKFGKIANDENDGIQLQSFLEGAFRAWLPALNNNAAWYLWHAQMTQGFFAAAAAAAAAANILIHRQIIWVKPSLVLGHGDFHWRHELCFYGWREGHRAKWLGDRKQTTVWEIGRENQHIHPTQKPVEIFARPMEYHTLPGQVCAEPFAGSGSQIIAGEKIGRRVFAMELDARYVDVCLTRWQDASGGTAIREDGVTWDQLKTQRTTPEPTPAPVPTAAADLDNNW